ncbi:hypothetical protein B1H10_08260 [candidate division KSB1 bacterium 4484_188]|nr:MAG: hypothetical protein B1H10_08260 [candidate division KSB1 bacterium 4484_188]
MERTAFNPELGHLEIQEKILAAIRAGRLPHAFLFYGNEGSGKDALAIELAKLLNCQKGPLHVCQRCPACQKIAHLQHPDVKFVFPIPGKKNVKVEEIIENLAEKAANPFRRIGFHGKNSFIAIDTVRELKREAKFKLYEGKKKVFIISDADQMQAPAANALLKILEECQLVHFPLLEGDVILKIIHKYQPETPANLAGIIRLAAGNIKLAFDFMQDNILEKRDQAVEFLRKIVVIEKKEPLINADIEENVGKFARAYPNVDFPFIISTVENAYQELGDPRNLNPTLIFLNLSIKLYQLIRNQS